MSYTAQDVITKARYLLEDPNGDRFTDTYLLSFLNDGIRELITIKPDASILDRIVTLISGAKQNIDGFILLDVLYNTSDIGSSIGKAVRRLKKSTLDFTNPDWMLKTPSATCLFYMYDMEDTQTFYVYPPSNGTNYVYTRQSVFPNDLTTTNQTIGLADEFRQSLIYYICYAAFSIDTDTANMTKADRFYQLFMGQISNNQNTEQTEEQKNAA